MKQPDYRFGVTIIPAAPGYTALFFSAKEPRELPVIAWQIKTHACFPNEDDSAIVSHVTPITAEGNDCREIQLDEYVLRGPDGKLSAPWWNESFSSIDETKAFIIGKVQEHALADTDDEDVLPS